MNSVPENRHPTIDIAKFRLEYPSLQIPEKKFKIVFKKNIILTVKTMSETLSVGLSLLLPFGKN